MTGATLGSLYRRCRDALQKAGYPTPALDARWLVAAAAGVEPQTVALHETDEVSRDRAETVSALLARRLAGEPVDRILGTREFWGLTFQLSPATLSPRPDTETLMGAALAHASDPARILDLGTGTGAILIALLHEYRRAHGVGVDRSPEAARTAYLNAASNGVADRAAFVVADWGSALTPGFHLIVSNPPYIPSGDIEALDPEVRLYDPRLSLDGGPDGLSAYRRVVRDAAVLLAPGGALVLELGIGQDAAVADLVRAAGLLPRPPWRDLSGIPRALVATAG